MLGKLAPNFSLWELVPERVYRELGQRAVKLLDVRIIISAQQLRNFYDKPVVINTWKNYRRTGWPKFEFRGFRPRWYTKTKAKYSQHYAGRAFDLNVIGVEPEQVRKDIRANRGEFAFITEIEVKTKGWVHIACPDPVGQNIRMVRG